MTSAARRIASSSLLSLLVVSGSMMSGCSTDFDEDAEQAEQDLVAGRTRLRLAAFIPCDAVDAMGLYDGDGRSFSYDGAAQSSRALLDVVVDPNGQDSFEPRMFPSKKFDASALVSKSGWCAKTRAGAVPKATKTAKSDGVYAVIKENARVEQRGGQSFQVTEVSLEAHAKNPLVPLGLAPNTDATLTVEIFYPLSPAKTKGAPSWLAWAGSHDAFPSWELYVDRVPVFQYDVLAAGKGATDLFPGDARKTSGVCERKAASWSCSAK